MLLGPEGGIVFKNKFMKKISWLLQSGLQVLYYVALYEVCIHFLKKKSLIKVDVAIGLSLKYMFYLFVTMSVIFAVVLYFKKEKTFIDCLYFIVCYSILFLILFGLSTNSVLSKRCWRKHVQRAN